MTYDPDALLAARFSDGGIAANGEDAPSIGLDDPMTTPDEAMGYAVWAWIGAVLVMLVLSAVIVLA